MEKVEVFDKERYLNLVLPLLFEAAIHKATTLETILTNVNQIIEWAENITVKE